MIVAEESPCPNAGFRERSFASSYFAGPSSRETRFVVPLAVTATGTISSRNTPSWMAWRAQGEAPDGEVVLRLTTDSMVPRQESP